jgi:hypothetical protein
VVCEAMFSWARALLSARWLLLSAGALLSTSAAKLSFPRDRSDLPDFVGGAPWKDTLDAGSVVTLDTGGLSRMNVDRDQQGPGQLGPKKIYNDFMHLNGCPAKLRGTPAPPFVPGGKICRGRCAKRPGVIASRECGLY